MVKRPNSTRPRPRTRIMPVMKFDPLTRAWSRTVSERRVRPNCNTLANRLFNGSGLQDEMMLMIIEAALGWWSPTLWKKTSRKDETGKCGVKAGGSCRGEPQRCHDPRA